MLEKPPTISIVIPAYNEERYLPGCLEAIAAQTIKPAEVIVVDNNSTDSTAEIAGRFPFVKLLHEPKQGIVYARNRGFDSVTSDIIARIDADTILPSDWIEKVEQFYAKPDHRTNVVTGGCAFYNLHTGHLAGAMYDLIVFRVNRWLLGHYFPWGSNTALPRAAWERVRSQVCLRTDIHEDLDLGLHLEAAGYHTLFQSSLRVGAVARRILTDRGDLWNWLTMWPRTVRVNGRGKTWPIWPLLLMVWLGRYWILVTEKLAGRFV